MGGIECLARVTGEPVRPARALVKAVPAKPAGGRVAPDSFKTPMLKTTCCLPARLCCRSVEITAAGWTDHKYGLMKRSITVSYFLPISQDPSAQPKNS